MTEGLDQGGRPVGGALLMEERRLVIVCHVGCQVALHHGNPTTPTTTLSMHLHCDQIINLNPFYSTGNTSMLTTALIQHV